MRTFKFGITAFMALFLSVTFFSCSSDDDETENNTAQAIAGTYTGYSIGNSSYFSNYLMGEDASATITANADGTINLVYKSGNGDFTLDNLQLSGRSFSGEGQVSMGMGTSTSTYDCTLEGSVSDSKVLTIKATVPSVMGGLTIEFIQGEAPEAYSIAGSYTGYSLGNSTYFQDYVLSSESTVTITANTDGTINLVYASGAGDFTLNNLEVSSRSFSGEGQVELSMSGGTPATYDYTLEGSVSEDGEATITATLPAVMGGFTIQFVQGEAPSTDSNS